MIARVYKDFDFLAAVHFDDQFMINHYNLNLIMDIVTDDEREQLIAIERIVYFLQNYVESSIFIHEKYKRKIAAYEKAGLKVLTLPEDPFDQIIGLALMSKFNAIAENRIIVSETIFGSKLSAQIKFHNYVEQLEEFEHGAWYNNSGLVNNFNKSKKMRKDKIVKFDELEDWNKLGLAWNS